MRLGNVIVPNSSYGEIIEEVVMPVLEDIYNDRLKETGKTGADAWIGFGSIHLVWELGKRICQIGSTGQSFDQYRDEIQGTARRERWLSSRRRAAGP